MKSIRCRMGWHKRKKIGGYTRMMGTKIFTECERCGLAEEGIIEDVLRHPLSKESARMEVIGINKVLSSSFEKWNKRGTMTETEFLRFQEKLREIQGWLMKYVGDWQLPLRDGIEGN